MGSENLIPRPFAKGLQRKSRTPSPYLIFSLNREQALSIQSEINHLRNHLVSPEPSEPYTFMPEPYLKYSADQIKFNGYATRYLSPRETGSWRVSKVNHISLKKCHHCKLQVIRSKL